MANNRRPRRFRGATLPNLAALDSRNADRYYRSGETSVIPKTPAHAKAVEAHAKDQARRRANSNPLAVLDERNADRYYRSDAGPKRKLKHVLRRQRVQPHIPQGSQTVRVNHPQSVHPLTALKREQIPDAVYQAILKVREGQERVLITAGNGLMMAVTSRLDSLMTRGQISEEERYKVTVKLLPKDKAPNPGVKTAPSKSVQGRVKETRSISEMLGEAQPAGRTPKNRAMTQDPNDFLSTPDAAEESELAPPPAKVNTKKVVDFDREIPVEDDDTKVPNDPPADDGE